MSLRPCSVEGCGRFVESAGLCSMHRGRKRRGKSLTEDPKRLSEEEKRLQNNRRNNQWRRNKRAAHPFWVAPALLSRNGWTNELTDQRLLEQKGRCAICGVVLSEKTFESNSIARDHDHETMAPRGLLCHHCNIMLGHYENHTRGRVLLQPFEDYLGRFSR